MTNVMISPDVKQAFFRIMGLKWSLVDTRDDIFDSDFPAAKTIPKLNEQTSSTHQDGETKQKNGAGSEFFTHLRRQVTATALIDRCLFINGLRN